MQLHQLLRFIKSGTPIVLFDIMGVEICNVRTKEDINIDLYEETIHDIGIMFNKSDSDKKDRSLSITLYK